LPEQNQHVNNFFSDKKINFVRIFGKILSDFYSRALPHPARIPADQLLVQNDTLPKTVSLKNSAYNDAMSTPQVTVTPARVKSGDPVYVAATGFTPNRTAMSHLIRPDGTEYNPLRFRTNDRGEFFHKIDTTMLDHGTFEVWVEDEASNVNSNRAQFTVEH
jgi:hypothetical protein